MANIKVEELKTNNLAEMIDLRSESETVNLAAFSPYKSLRGGTTVNMWRKS